MKLLRAKDFFGTDILPLRVLHREPQPPYGSHHHEFSELVIVTGGRGVHVTQQGDIPISMGDVFIISPYEVHGYRELEGLGLVNIIFEWERLPLPELDLHDVAGFHTLFILEPRLRRHYSAQRLRLRFEALQYALNLVERLENELVCELPGYRFRTLALFMELIIWLARQYEPVSGAEDGMIPHRLGEVLGYLEHHFTQPISIEQLARMAGLSRSSLFRTFKRALGVSPLEYLLRLRLKHACRNLRQTDEPISEIAFNTGFHDSNYFSRKFKAVMGMSPSEYRHRNRICFEP